MPLASAFRGKPKAEPAMTPPTHTLLCCTSHSPAQQAAPLGCCCSPAGPGIPRSESGSVPAVAAILL
jgi:hypothetical protein